MGADAPHRARRRGPRAAEPDRYDRYLFAGDHTALPQIARYLETLPPDTRGWVFVEVADAAEEVDLGAPEGVTITWLHRAGVAAGRSDVLARAVSAVAVPPGESVYVWVAGEAGSIIAGNAPPGTSL